MTTFRCEPDNAQGSSPVQAFLRELGRVNLVLGMAVAVSGCSVVDPSVKSLNCYSGIRLSGLDKQMADPLGRKLRAVKDVKLARQVKTEAKAALLGIGALSGTLSRVSGTNANALAKKVRNLKVEVANEAAIDLAIIMHGNSPLPNANWACVKLANSIASLDTGQSDDQFLENVAVVEAYFKKMYQKSGGRNLERDLRQAPTFGPMQI